MRIGVDVMGGDNAPAAILEGALDAIEQLPAGDELVLAGDAAVIEPAVRGLDSRVRGNDGGRGSEGSGGVATSGVTVTVVPTTEVIAMDESPVEAVRGKPGSSMAVIAKLASRKADNPIDIFISAGNTGAQVTAAQMHMRRLPHVHRPGIAVVVPTFSGPVVLIDVGANIEPKPHHLAQYGVMGDVYASRILGIRNPRVALMNVGGEEQKGTQELKQARDFLRNADGLNFTGYIEGRAVFNGEADVVITDGIVGNVMIKLAEGLSSGIFKALGRELKAQDPELAMRLGPVIKKLYADHDYHEYGGAPLLGVNGGCIICHGSSVARTITNAILRARQFVESGVNEAIVQRLSTMEEAA